MTYEDILYDRDGAGIVTITINRPDRLNAFRPQIALGMTGLALNYDTEESAEGTVAFQERRPPDFGRFRK